MKNKNLLLLFSAGAIVIVLSVLVSVVQNRQEVRQRAQGPSHLLPTQAYRNPFYPTRIPQGNVTIPLPPNGQAFTAPNDIIPPTVAITSPVNGATVQANTPATIVATASDNVGVSKVEFLVNGVLLCTKIASPYTCTWNVPFQTNTTYLIIARAYDLTGNLASKSTTVRTR